MEQGCQRGDAVALSASSRSARGLAAVCCLALAACGKDSRTAPTPTPPESVRVAQTVVIIHGVGNQKAGYSEPLQALLKLRIPDAAFSEVLWSDLGTFLMRTAPEANPELRRAEAEWEQEMAQEERRLEMMRSPHLDTERARQEHQAARGYVGPILQYEFLSRAERLRIQGRLRDAIERAARNSDRIAVVAHSLGSVIAFDVLHGWEQDGAPLRADLFCTFGSPLNKSIFRGHNGRPVVAPPSVSSWINVYSPSDMIASGLGPGYVGVTDRRIETSVLPLTAHSSYWTHPEVIGLFATAGLAMGNAPPSYGPAVLRAFSSRDLPRLNPAGR